MSLSLFVSFDLLVSSSLVSSLNLPSNFLSRVRLVARVSLVANVSLVASSRLICVVFRRSLISIVSLTVYLVSRRSSPGSSGDLVSRGIPRSRGKLVSQLVFSCGLVWTSSAFCIVFDYEAERPEKKIGI